MTIHRGLRRWLHLQFASAVVAVALANARALQMHIALASKGSRSVFAAHALPQMTYWLCWALWWPVIVLVAQRAAFAGATPGAIARRAVPWLLLVVFCFPLMYAPLSMLERGETASIPLVYWGTLVSNSFETILVFVVVFGITYALDTHQRALSLEVGAARLNEQVTQARLDALRAQLNPHFLFNAMNTVAMLVRRREETVAIRTIANLSELLRYALNDRTQTVPLREELVIAQQYLDIERIRFGEKLKVWVNVSDELLDITVPTLLLLPLVENAVRHGVGQRAAGGSIRIDAHVADGMLCIDVQDDGPGPNAVRATQGHGVGLRNTRARLEEQYGSAATLELRTEFDGTIVRLALPLATSPSRGLRSRVTASAGY